MAAHFFFSVAAAASRRVPSQSSCSGSSAAGGSGQEPAAAHGTLPGTAVAAAAVAVHWCPGGRAAARKRQPRPSTAAASAAAPCARRGPLPPPGEAVPPLRKTSVRFSPGASAACRCSRAAAPPLHRPAACVLRAAAVSLPARAVALPNAVGFGAAATLAAGSANRDVSLGTTAVHVAAAASSAVGRYTHFVSRVAAADAAAGRASRAPDAASTGAAEVHGVSTSSRCCGRLGATLRAKRRLDRAAAALSAIPGALASAAHPQTRCIAAPAAAGGAASAAVPAAAATGAAEAWPQVPTSRSCRSVGSQQPAASTQDRYCCCFSPAQQLSPQQRDATCCFTLSGPRQRPQRSCSPELCHPSEVLPLCSSRLACSGCSWLYCPPFLLPPSLLRRDEKRLRSSDAARPLWLHGGKLNCCMRQVFKREGGGRCSSLAQQQTGRRETNDRGGGNSQDSRGRQEQPVLREGGSCCSSSATQQQQLAREWTAGVHCYKVTSPQQLLLRRSFASLSKAEQHKKRMRRILQKRRRWKLPHVSKHYLRAEADFNVLSVQRPAASLSQLKKTARSPPPPAATLIEVHSGEEAEEETAWRHAGEEEGRDRPSTVTSTLCSSRRSSLLADAQKTEQHQQQQQRQRLLKPHEVARLLQPDPLAGGTTDDKANLADLACRRSSLPLLSSTVVRPLHLADVDDGTKRLGAGQLKMPAGSSSTSSTSRSSSNGSTKEELDFVGRKGDCGHPEKDDVYYYRRFFKDRYRRLDGREKEVQQLTKKKEEEDARLRTRKRPYIPPKQYWYRADYESPLPGEVLRMKSFALKFALMNEARAVKLGRKPLDLPLWRAFEARLLQLASHRSHVRAATLLRGLHALSKIQHVALPETLDGVIRGLMYREPTLKPQHYVFLLQALARLRYRHVYVLHALKEMVVSWPVLRNNFLLKAANAVAKLGLASHILCKPLQVAIAVRIPGFTASNCCRVKWITAVDVFSNAMLLSFLRRCQQQEQAFRRYSRTLQVLELYVRVQQPELYLQLPPLVQYFLERLRVAHTEDAEEGEEDTGEENGVDSSDESDEGGSPAEEFFFSETTSSSAATRAAPRLSITSFAPGGAAAAAAAAEFEAAEAPSDAEAWKEETAAGAAETGVAAEQQQQRKAEPANGAQDAESYTASAACHMQESIFARAHTRARKESERSQAAWDRPERRDGTPESEGQTPYEDGDAEEEEEDEQEEEEEEKFCYASALHGDVSRLLHMMGVKHFNGVRAGPFRVDIYHPGSNTVIETCPAFQFYSNSVEFTALSKRRHQLLLSMGFQLVLVPYQRWEGLRSDEEKQQLLRRTLPPEVFSSPKQQHRVPALLHAAATS